MDPKIFDDFFESLKTSSNYPSIYEKYEEMTSSKFKFSMFHHDKVENMNTQEFIFHLNNFLNLLIRDSFSIVVF